jgi:pimeloyl-ACP methyl ester carboxylesterase
MSKLIRDGVVLNYEEAGTGEIPLVFLHPWGGDRTFFAPQVEYFRNTYRVITVDLRGHGLSDKPAQAYTLAGFADDVAWVCAPLGAAHPILVGNSLGGIIAVVLGSHPQLKPRAVAVLDSPLVPPPGLIDQFRPLVAALRSPMHREALRHFAEQFSGFNDRPELHDRMVEHFLGNSPEVLASALEDCCNLDSAPAAAACKVPLLFVSSGPWFTDVARLRELCPQLLTAQTVGSGHYHQLEVPEQINAILARFFQIALRAPSEPKL